MQLHKLRVIVVEDEKSELIWLCDRLQEFDEIEVIATASTTESAYQAIIQYKPDIVFLDIQLDKDANLYVLDRLYNARREMPYIVYTSGFIFNAEEAINAPYKDKVLHYLSKPFAHLWVDKIRMVLDKHQVIVEEQKANEQGATKATEDRHTFLKIGRKNIRFNHKDIISITVALAGSGQVYIVTEQGSFLYDDTLIRTLNVLDNPRMVQVARDQAVNLDWLVSIEVGKRHIGLRNAPERYVSIGNKFLDNFLVRLRQEGWLHMDHQD